MATSGFSPPAHSITNAQQAVYDATAAASKRSGLGAPAVVTTSSNIETKTPVVIGPAAVTKVIQGDRSNVLNKYRSFTYNFTLSALHKLSVNDPLSYRKSELDLVIAKSGGKGTTGISNKVSSVDTEVSPAIEAISENGQLIIDKVAQVISQDFSGAALVDSFNEKSPGRFDMFIDNVEIESLMAFTQDNGNSLPTRISFDIIEPYSINGFIEAIHVAAVAAGYPTYTQASFLLKMEFVGYLDTEEFSDPVFEPGAVRYFVFGFTGVDVDITEKGTRYKCSGVPYNERAFGLPDQLKQPINISGIDVSEILKDFMTQLNAQVKKADTDGATNNTNQHNTYSIEFPPVNGVENAVGKAKLHSLLASSNIYKFPAPAKEVIDPDKKSTPVKKQANATVVYNPTTPVVQFAAGGTIHESITAIIRDSEYVTTILSTLGEAGKIGAVDEYGLVDYFIIKIEVTNLTTINQVTKHPFQNYKYVVTPYKVNYTRIPTYQAAKLNGRTFTKLSTRDYNYVYTGKNIDVLDFKLNFNTLFFEAIPAAMGNSEKIDRKTAVSSNNNLEVKQNPNATVSDAKTQTATAPTKVTSDAGEVNPGGLPNAGQPGDAYSVLAKNMHNAIINSKASLLTGEISILGDPFFLVTGGIGNYKPVTLERGITTDNEADHNAGEVLITINFRNPIDIQSLEDGGTLKFDPKRVPFSGVYMVTRVNSSFKDGQFKQRLEIIRSTGQLDADSDKPATDPSKVNVTSPDPTDAIIADATLSSNPSGRPSTINLLTQIGSAIPSSGLPGALSSFAAATGGLGGTINGLVSQGVSAITGSSAIFGSLPGNISQLASGIRLQLAGLTNIAQSSLGASALINQVSNTIQGALPVTNIAASLTNNIVANATAAASTIAVLGSGIGKGATVALNANESVTVSPTITSFSGAAATLTSNATAAISSVGNQAAGLVNGISNSIASLTAGSPVAALASKFGINVSDISGLNAATQSKILTQASDLAKTIPVNVDLAAATSRGLVLDYLPTSTIANIPATAPFATAPLPEVDQQFLTRIIKNGGQQALANAYGVSDISKISSNLLPAEVATSVLNSAPSILKNPFASLSSNINLPDITALGGKLASVNAQLSSFTGTAGSVESMASAINNTLGSTGINPTALSSAVTSKFGSISQGLSPLSKIMSNKGEI